MKYGLALAIALTTAFAAHAETITISVTNTYNSISYTTKCTYEIDADTASARLIKAKPILGETTIENIIVVTSGEDEEIYFVDEIADGAFADNKALTSVTIPTTILKVGDNAFSNCTSLASVTLEYGVRYLGARAFANTIIKEITLPDSILDMGGNIAAGAPFLSTINISDSSHFCYSDDGVLYNRDMTKLYACPTRAEGTIAIPDSVTNICADAFFGCHRLTYLNVPTALSTIGSGAFNVSGMWPGLDAPESTPKLKSVFYNGAVPDAADDIYAGSPEDLVSYGSGDDWSALSEWKDRAVTALDDANPPVLEYTDADGITWFYRIVNGEAEIYNEVDGVPSAAISPSSTSGATYRNADDGTSCTALMVPVSINGFAVTKIGPCAFNGCSALIRIGIPTSIGEIGDYAFCGCTATTSIAPADSTPWNWPQNTIELPNGMARLGYHPFEGLKVSEVSLPYTLEETDGNPVAGCGYVSTLTIDSSSPSFYSDGNILYNKLKTTLVAVPANHEETSISPLSTTVTLGKESMFGCRNLTAVTMPSALKTIGERAFAGCTSIESISLPEALQAIESAAFTNCTSLINVNFGGNAPEAADDIYSGTPEDLTSYIGPSASGFTEGTWKSRAIVVGEVVSPGFSVTNTIDGVEWIFSVTNNKAKVVGISGYGSTVTIPTTADGYPVTSIDPAVLATLDGVEEFISLSDSFTARNGVLYSADSTHLVRVPDEMTLPYTVIMGSTSETISVTTVPGVQIVNGTGVDTTKVTTNRVTTTYSATTNTVSGDISTDSLFENVLIIGDYAFTGCNVFTNSCIASTNEAAGGETGYTTSGKPYVTAASSITSESVIYDTTITLPSTIVGVSANAFANSGVTVNGDVPTLTTEDYPYSATVQAYSSAAALSIAEEIMPLNSPFPSIVGDTAYRAYFSVTATSADESGSYTVTAVLDDDAIEYAQSVADMGTAISDVAAGTTDQTTLSVKPGLYYAIAAASTLGGTYEIVDHRLATGTSLTLKMVRPSTESGYYKLLVGVTDITSCE